MTEIIIKKRKYRAVILPFQHFVIRTVYAALMILPLFLSPVSAETSPPAYPFHPGEKMTFTLRWGIIYAGEATLEVLPVESLGGKTVYHFVMTAETNSFIDAFYKVRDRIDAYADTDMTRSVLFKKKQREGKSKRDITVTFDWQKQEVQYVNRGDIHPPVSLMPGTFDPLSAFYFTRLTDFSKNAVLKRPVSDGKKNVMGIVSMKKRETVKIGKKSYDTFLLEPDLKDVKGVFEKSKDASIKIWITADERRIPVKIASKVIVGSFVGELLSFTPGTPVKNQKGQPEKGNTDGSENIENTVEQH